MHVGILDPGQDSCKVVAGTGELLEDRDARGRERPWEQKKRAALLVARGLADLGHHGPAARCRECGTTLVFAECPAGHGKRLRRANFCRERLCPMCAWRRSLRLAHDVSRVLHEAAAQQPQRRWVMLTLTQRTVPSEALPEEVQHVLYGWKLLRERRELAQQVTGTFRVLEVTRSKDGTWHPHIHALLWVAPTYFGEGYVTQARWRALWREALGLDYLPVVEVHAVRPRQTRGQTRDHLAAAAAEVGKYTVKQADLVPPEATTAEVADRVAALYPALRGRRLVEWSGDLRVVAHRLDAQQPDEGDLVHTTDEDHGPTCPICGTGLREHVFTWVAAVRHYVG